MADKSKDHKEASEVTKDATEAKVDEKEPASEEKKLTDLELAQVEVALERDKFLRLYAEFENYKKRAFKDREVQNKFGSERLLSDLLPILDHLGQAIAHAEKDAAEPAVKNLIVGVNMVLKQFEAVLERNSLHSFKSEGETFDPNKHEAVHYEPRQDVPKGHVAAEFQKGYMLHDRLVRPARVVVSKGAPEPKPEENTKDKTKDKTKESTE